MKYAQIVLLAGLALAGACKSTSSASVETNDIPCTCGQPEADFDGCANATCAKGMRNPDKPDCVCGPLDMAGNGVKQ